jgi:hypothetical protein
MHRDRTDNGSSAFEALARAGIRKPADVERLVMYELSRTRLENLSRELTNHGSMSTFREAAGPFEFALSRRMAGGTGGCVCWDCRVAAVNSTATFAALYADRVFVVNPFWNYTDLGEADWSGDSLITVNTEYALRFKLAGEIKALLALEPLFRNGIADLVTPGIATCAKCSKRLALALKRRRIEQRVRSIEAKYLARCTIEMSDDAAHIIGPALSVHVPEELDDIVLSWPAPSRLVRKWARGSSVGMRDVQRLRPLRPFLQDAVADVVFQYVMALARGARYLTDRKLDAELISAISEPAESRMSAALAKNLLCSLPVIANAPLKKVLAVRTRERESFILYRDAMSKALGEVAKGERTGRELREIYSDVIEPELARLQLKIRKLRTGPLLRAVDEAVIVSGIMAVGVAGNVFPAAVSQLAAAAGAVHLAKELGKGVLARLRVPEDVRTDKFYFLWRLGARAAHKA